MIASLLMLWTLASGAQPAGQLAGVVRDATGAVLPGVEVTVTGTWRRGGRPARRITQSPHSLHERAGQIRSRQLARRSLQRFRHAQRVRSAHRRRECRCRCGDAGFDAGCLPGLRDGDGDRDQDRHGRYPDDTHCYYGALEPDPRAAGCAAGRRPHRCGAIGHDV